MSTGLAAFSVKNERKTSSAWQVDIFEFEFVLDRIRPEHTNRSTVTQTPEPKHQFVHLNSTYRYYLEKSNVRNAFSIWNRSAQSVCAMFRFACYSRYRLDCLCSLSAVHAFVSPATSVVPPLDSTVSQHKLFFRLMKYSYFE